ncbi:unannotated protein [freshwater metagenome]|uniref:Unannotated protein n=1 Tax=freshwater metagenome TaxID=449393 RepID=A0A6J6C8Y3_9ZZZZ
MGSNAAVGVSSTVVAVTTVAPSLVAPLAGSLPTAVTGTAAGAWAAPVAFAASVAASSAWAIRPTPPSVAVTLTPVATSFEPRV